MEEKEKAEIIDRVLKALYHDNSGNLPELLNGNQYVGHKETWKYQIIEHDLIHFDLVRVLIPPGTNKTINGFGEYAIGPKGRELMMNKRSSFELYQPSKKEALEFELAESTIRANNLNERNNKFNRKFLVINGVLAVVNLFLLLWQIVKE
jgi:hypothetical protein